jgi:hypothetical protein
MNKIDKNKIKEHLFDKLVENKAFWSYNSNSVVFSNINDTSLIYHTLIRLDVEDIGLLFTVFGKEKVKNVWKTELAIQGDFYKNLNVFYAICYFDIKNPVKYIASVQKKHFSNLEKQLPENWIKLLDDFDNSR